MRKRTIFVVAAIAAIIAAGAASLYMAYYNSFYAIDRANALFSRAETAGFAEDMIVYLHRGANLLPKSGNPVWWFPTDRTDFSEINKDLNQIIDRATILESLPRNSSAYQQGMDDLRGKIRALEVQVAEASGYMFVSAWNVVFSLAWLAAFGVILFAMRRR